MTLATSKEHLDDAHSEFLVVECPICGTSTDSLKLCEVVRTCIFFGLAIFRTEYVTACPACMRKYLWRRCFINLLPANILWVAWIFPRSLIQVLLTHKKGHSRRIQADASESAVAEVFDRVPAETDESAPQECLWCDAAYIESVDGRCPSCNRPVD